MNKTNNSLVVTVKNQYVLDMLFSIAESKNIEICKAYKSQGPKVWNVFKFDKSRNKVIGLQEILDCNEYNIISLESMIIALESYNPIARIKLTDDYTAILDTENCIVTVGCQTIPFYKVKELYNAIYKS